MSLIVNSLISFSNVVLWANHMVVGFHINRFYAKPCPHTQIHLTLNSGFKFLYYIYEVLLTTESMKLQKESKKETYYMNSKFS